MAEQRGFTEQLERRARRAIFWHALLRWESAVLVSLTLVASAFLGLAAWVGLLQSIWAFVALGIGLVIWAIIVISSITDDADNARVVAAMLRERCDPGKLRSQELQTRMEKALEYRRLAASTVLRTEEGVLRDRLMRVTEPLDRWIEAIYGLAARLDTYKSDPVIRQDLQSVPIEVENFREQLDREDDAKVRSALQETIADKERQHRQLIELENTMEKAEYQLESTLAALGTVYAQLQAIGLQGAERGGAERLRQEIDEQVAQLQDLSEAMDEVYQGR